MKTFSRIFIPAALAVIGAGSLASCSFLEVDKYFDEQLTIEKVFSNKDYTENWLNNTFSYMNYVVDVSNQFGTVENFADDLCFNGSDYTKFKTVSYDESYRQKTWTYCWQGINKACVFIAHIDGNTAVSEAERADYKAQARFARAYYYWALLRKYGPIPLLPDEGADYSDSYDNLSIPRRSYEECAEYIASEFALAAAGLPLRRDATNAARPTRGAALAYRAKVLLYEASPLANGNDDAYAQRLLDDQGNRLLSQEYDESKWAKAAAAARDVIELGQYDLYTAKRRNSANSDYEPKTVTPFNDGEFYSQNWPDGYADIDPFESYRSLFNGAVKLNDNPEIIFSRGKNGANGWNAAEQEQEAYDLAYFIHEMLPVAAGGSNCISITQKQCDAFYMYDGKDLPGKDSELGRGDGSARPGMLSDSEAANLSYSPQLGTNVEVRKNISRQYANREPRFYASVAYNGSVWYRNSEVYTTPQPLTSKQCWYYRDNVNGKKAGTSSWPLTGIGFKKYVHPQDSNLTSDSKILDKAEPAIRYADILLCYAEALNELDGSYSVPSWDGKQTYTISRSITELERGIHPVRIRAGLPDFADEVYGDKALFREKLKRERQIELLGECQRYYDLRRWKDAEKETIDPIYGCNMNISQAGSNSSEARTLFHTPVEIPSVPAVFVEKSYFWPFAKDELKRNRRLTQNPGWNVND